MLNVHSIFSSIDGEVNAYHQGRLAAFLRLSNCNLRCSYCDTRRAQLPSQGTSMEVEEVANQIQDLGIRKLTITGGEPLLQVEGLRKLLHLLDPIEHDVTIETNGSLPPDFNLPAWYVMDYKLPSSGMEGKMNLKHFHHLRNRDWVKFVVSNQSDFLRAYEVLGELGTGYSRRVGVAFSPAGGTADLPQNLVKWMIEKKLDSVFSLQIHRLLWPEGDER